MTSKLTALVEAAKAATQDDRWMAAADAQCYEVGIADVPITRPLSRQDALFITLANPATILELCALLEKAEGALDDAETYTHPDTVSEALAAIKQWKGE